MKRCSFWISLIVVMLGAFTAEGQKKDQPWPVTATIFDNATLLPGGGKLGIIGIPVHPGFSVGSEYYYKNGVKNQWFQTGKLAYQYHRYVQHAIELYSELGYRRHFGPRFDSEFRLGAGYLHAIPATQVFKLNSQGDYERSGRFGRPQFMGSTALGLGYRLAGTPERPIRVTLAYQFYLQLPFVREYVPLLPNSALHIGLSCHPFTKA